MQVIIATVPDPIDSRGDWAFDSYFEAIRRAFERSGYLPDRYWLPWTADRDRRLSSAGEPLRRSAPGVLLFRERGSDAAAVVLLVGEIPTTGVQARAFQDALGQVVALIGTTQPIRIVGPTFSGSSKSLHDGLVEFRRSHQSTTASIVSGSATDVGNVEMLRNDKDAFRATVYPDSMLGHVRHLVTKSLGIDDVVALVVEASTAYGQSISAEAGPGTPSELHLPVPIGIGSLREAYLDSGAALPEVPGKRQAPFEISLRDPGSVTEVPPVQSRLTAPALETELDVMADIIDHRHRKAVGIMASDIRDQLFLARQIRQRVHGVVLFTHQSNALFLWPGFADATEGMIVVTTYPLIPMADSWIDSTADTSEALAFPNEGAEGVFNATLIQLGREHMVEGYASPRGSVRLPVIWVTAVGRDGFVPLGVFAPPDPQDYVQPIAVSLDTSSQPRPTSKSNGEARGYAGVAALLLGLAAAIAAGLVFLNKSWRELWTVQPDGRARRIVRSALLAHWHLYGGLLGIALIGLAASFEALVWAATSERRMPWLWVAVAAPGAPLIAWHVWKILRLVWTDTRNSVTFILRSSDGLVWTAEILFRTILVFFGLAFALGLFRFLQQLDYVGGVARSILAFRILHIDSGLSPLVPLGIGSFTLILWTTWHLERIATLMVTTPLDSWALSAFTYDITALPRKGEVVAPRALQRALVAVRVRLFLLAQRRWSVVLLLVLLAAAVAVALRVDRTIERFALRDAPIAAWWLEALYRFVVSAAFASVIWGAYRLLSVWSALRDVLNQLSASPLLSAFERLPERVAALTRVSLLGRGSASGVAEIARTQWNHLRGLYVHAKDQISAHLGVPTAQKIAAFHLTAGGTAPPILRTGVLAPTTAPKDITALLDILNAGWEAEPSETDVSLVKDQLRAAKVDDRQHATSGRIRRAVANEERLWLRALEEYMALHVVQYLEWVLEVMRRLSAFLVLTLIASTVLLTSHPGYDVGIIQAFFFVALVWTIGVLAYVLTRMSRDEVLCRINGTDPGRVNWDSGFIINILTFAAVPTLAILSAVFPAVRGFLLAWVQPLLHSLVRG